MPRKQFNRKGAAKVDVGELARARYLDVKSIRGSEFVVTDMLPRAAFPTTSAELREAADRALVAELEASIEATDPFDAMK